MTLAAVTHSDGSAPDFRDPTYRLSQLVDPESLEVAPRAPGVAVIIARGRINGAPIIVYCTDATVRGGAIGVDECPLIAKAIDLAAAERIPVVGVWHSGGAKLAEGVAAMDAIGQVFAAMVRASGQVLQLSVVLGPAAGGAAYGPALTDMVIMSESGRLFVTGPDVVRAVTGEQIDMEGLGGVEAHGRRSGVVHVVTDCETAAYQRAREVVTFVTRPGQFDEQAVSEDRDLRALLPTSPKRAYDVRPLIEALMDEPQGGPDDRALRPGFLELQVRWAPNMVIGLGRLAGRTIGVVANNPIRKGGCLDSLSAEKASRFVRMCDALGIPLLVIVDVPGYLPGVSQEWDGVIRRGAKLLHAFAEAVVPRVTLLTRKSYGGAYIAMNSRSLGAGAVLAWPEAEVAVMGAAAAVEILHRRKLAAVEGDERRVLRDALAAEHEITAGGVRRAVSIGVVDEVVEPTNTRRRLVQILATMPVRRGHHRNIPL